MRGTRGVLSSRRLPLAMAAVATSAIIAAGLQAQQTAAPAADAREQGVRELIDRYFLTWNAQDIERYGQCFMPQAAVQLLDPNGRLTTLSLRAFLQTQREAHARTQGLHETPETVDVKFEGQLARVVVSWKLVSGDQVQSGYDHFTLIPSGGQWRIANLIFYETPQQQGR